VKVTVNDVLQSRIPHSIGKCATDLPEICSYLNEAISRLLIAAPDTGWWKTWEKVVFNVDRTTPYLTLPAKYARAAGIDICRTPVGVNNEWYEFMEYGVGLQTICTSKSPCAVMDAFDRGSVATAYDLTPTNQLIRVYLTDIRDVGRKILFTGAIDQNGNGIYEQNGLTSLNGFMLTLTTPFVTSGFIVTAFSSVTKDPTYGDVVVKQVDATTGVEVLLARYTPDEITPQYRRYLISGMPCNCCPVTGTNTVQVTAMCKLDFKPVKRPTDVLLIGNLAALKEEMQSIKFSEQDSSKAMQFSLLKHQQAVKLLNLELASYTGPTDVAVNVSIFGSARLEHQGIGTMV
jgi:hypothetical protein